LERSRSAARNSSRQTGGFSQRRDPHRGEFPRVAATTFLAKSRWGRLCPMRSRYSGEALPEEPWIRLSGRSRSPHADDFARDDDSTGSQPAHVDSASRGQAGGIAAVPCRDVFTWREDATDQPGDARTRHIEDGEVHLHPVRQRETKRRRGTERVGCVLVKNQAWGSGHHTGRRFDVRDRPAMSLRELVPEGVPGTVLDAFPSRTSGKSADAARTRQQASVLRNPTSTS
jgi:hypothetical protein